MSALGWKQPASCPTDREDCTIVAWYRSFYAPSHGRGVWQSPSDGGNCWPHSAARRRGRSRHARSIAPAFEGLKERADAVYVPANPLILSNMVRLNILAVGARLPASYIAREYVQGGGLLAYGPSFVNIYRRAGDFFDKILRGTKPGDIPVEQPTKFDLIVNLTTAKVLGLKISPTFLALADEVIE